MSRKLRLLLIVLPFVVIVAIFVPRYGLDAVVSIPMATVLAYVGLYVARAAVLFVIQIGWRNGS